MSFLNQHLRRVQRKYRDQESKIKEVAMKNSIDSILKIAVRSRSDDGIKLSPFLIEDGSTHITKEHVASHSAYYHKDGLVYYGRIASGMDSALSHTLTKILLKVLIDYHCTIIKPTLDQRSKEWVIMERY